MVEVVVPQVQFIDKPNTHDDLEAGSIRCIWLRTAGWVALFLHVPVLLAAGNPDMISSSTSLLSLSCSVSGYCTECKMQYCRVYVGMMRSPFVFFVKQCRRASHKPCQKY